MEGCLDWCRPDRRFLFNWQMGAQFVSRQWYGGFGVWRRQFADYATSLDLLLVPNFTLRCRVHAGLCQRIRVADQTRQVRCESRTERSGTTSRVLIDAINDLDFDRHQ